MLFKLVAVCTSLVALQHASSTFHSASGATVRFWALYRSGFELYSTSAHTLGASGALLYTTVWALYNRSLKDQDLDSLSLGLTLQHVLGAQQHARTSTVRLGPQQYTMAALNIHYGTLGCSTAHYGTQQHARAAQQRAQPLLQRDSGAFQSRVNVNFHLL